MKRAISILGFLLFASSFAFLACGPSHTGKTVGKGTLQLEAGVGGPLFKNIVPGIPIPNAPVGARFGVADRIDIYAHTNVLTLVAGGFMTLDAGTTWGLYQHEGSSGYNLAMSTGLLVLTDFQTATRLAPLMDMAGGYSFDWLTVFGGVEMAMDLYRPNIITNPFIGLEADIKKVSLSLTGIYFNPGFDSSSSPVQYVSPNNRGAVGVMLGFKIRLNLLSLNTKEGANASL